MSDILALKSHPRDGRGSRAAHKLRKTGRIPAVVYGHKEAPAHIALELEEFDRAVRKLHARTFTITVAGKPETVLIKELQWDHLGKEMIHVDLIRVSATERVKVTVPVELRGAPKTMGGGVLDQPFHHLHVECSPLAIPDAIRIDVTNLTLGNPIHVNEIAFPAGVTPLDPPEAVVVHIKLPGAEAALPEATAAEPEVLTAKKPKEGEDEK
jgi:large subunit ribosomal protein L25